ncbi:MAG: DinB family protein [Bacteroidota bacterium]
MTVSTPEAIAILERTPATLRAWLSGLPEAWLDARDGPETWSPHEVVAHLIAGERVDWMPRLRTILDHGESQPFTPFDRGMHQAEADATDLDTLLDRFATLRAENLAALRALALTDADLDRTGTHPDFGRVTARQLLATWAAHDLSHIVQIARTMARQYADAVGPWRAYLSVMPPEASGE